MSTLPTPRTDAVAKQIGSIAARWKNRDIGAQLFSDLCEQQFDHLRSQERELAEAKAERDALLQHRDEAMNHAIDADSSRAAYEAQNIDPEADLAALRSVADGLAALLKVAVCPDQNCDGKGSSWHVEQSSQTGEPEQVQHQCQWCDERDTALAHFRDAANPASGAAITPDIHRSE